LPGIGVFSIDPSLQVPDVTDKNFPEFLQQIKYTQKTVLTADDDFINFIRTETGKIRPLAESDLDSFLSDGKILMNIGKPFHFEGIGSVLKKKDGEYEFIAGEPLLDRLEGFSHHGHGSEEGSKKKSVYSDDRAENNNVLKLLIGLGVIAGIFLIIWGGYTLYNRNTSGSSSSETPGNEQGVLPATQDSAGLNLQNNAANKVDESTVAEGNYKFIIERTSNKGRANRRYKQLKDNFTDIRMETKDSTRFNLYFVLPARPSDTARIRDSLKNWYGSKTVDVER
jgi:hypothetical protein